MYKFDNFTQTPIFAFRNVNQKTTDTKMKNRFLFVLLIAFLSVQCTQKKDIIQENVDYAKSQLAYLIEAAEDSNILSELMTLVVERCTV